MGSPWSAELWRIAGLAALALLVGLLSGQVALALLLAALLYLVWHLYQLAQLERWLRLEKGYNPPDAPWIWGEVYHHLYRVQQSNRSRKRRLAGYIREFQDFTAAMPDATVVLRAGGEIEWFNEAAGRLLGLRSADRGQRIDNLLRHPQFTEFLAQARRESSVDFPSPVAEAVMLSARIVPYGQSLRLLVVRDVTRLHRLEQTRRDFVANVSHELRTPLTVVGGFLENMAAPDDECLTRWERPIALMSEQTKRMQRIVEELLMLSRLETEQVVVRPEPVAVAAMLESICEEARALSGEQGHAIELQAEAGLGLRGSESELRSAFSNLVANAVRYTPAGGRITLRWYADARGAHFSVADTGVGIAAQHIARLTERFYRVDVGRSRRTGGTGLGLAIVKHVLERHQARLRIESRPGQGSTFSCDFPPSLVLHHDVTAGAGPLS